MSLWLSILVDDNPSIEVTIEKGIQHHVEKIINFSKRGGMRESSATYSKNEKYECYVILCEQVREKTLIHNSARVFQCIYG